MWSLKFEIRKVKNGWLLAVQDEESTTLVQEETFDNEAECFLSFLQTVVEEFEPISKRKAKNIVPVMMPGYAYEGEIDKKYLEKLIELRDQLNDTIDAQQNPTRTE